MRYYIAAIALLLAACATAEPPITPSAGRLDRLVGTMTANCADSDAACLREGLYAAMRAEAELLATEERTLAASTPTAPQGTRCLSYAVGAYYFTNCY